ncbi:heavy metal translocating P-type ATPase [Mycolicibacterium sp.]|uniref:heavy metal translocating P-type ATPase n=1 Tax=Mycolicibacterium sp. TaxID=2320850 RepID=UPI001A1B7FB3|nr:heavy metal translocating P-type ATPase [Mycolicibacterium sp.]MBJ7338113.1 heavy metal translocating P-type ATPase [Mycolicibacterium sp.]
MPHATDQAVAHATPAQRLARAIRPTLLATTVVALLAGGAAWLWGDPQLADWLWGAATVVAVVPAVWWALAGLRHGHVGVDVIAVLSLLGALAVGEYLAGALVGVMLATGQTLDAAAERRATKDLRSLLAHAPSNARRRTADGLEVVPADAVAVDDLVVIGAGEVVPVDGRITSGSALFDESALTGESVPVKRHGAEMVRSGVVNAGGTVDIRATATSADSTYAGIVRLARKATAASAPVVRLADRVAAWFVPFALAMAGGAWVWSGSAERAVAVLVVATPCPLLLAAPVAIVSGLSRASRLGVIVRDGGALETLGVATTLVMDKTGTLTTGQPHGTDVVAAPGRDRHEVLRLAASADQVSAHVLARAIVEAAQHRDLRISMPTDVVEQPGAGVVATVDGQRVAVGMLSLPVDAPRWARAVVTKASLDGAVIVWVSVGSDIAGAILLIDPVRPDAPHTLHRLRLAGLNRLVMLSGDRLAPAEDVAAVLGLDAVHAHQSPADKVARVQAESRDAVTVMVGDGVNDAPALAAANVGVAMGARGSTASSEAADVVLTTDRLDRLADAIGIARRARRIAVQSAVVGMGLSVIAMALAAVGLVPPAAGALLQEVIDVAVIVNALRALRGGDVGTPALSDHTELLIHRFAEDHVRMRDELSVFGETARAVTAGDPIQVRTLLTRADDFLQKTLLPHEAAEDHELYPALAQPLGSASATTTMSRMHGEIVRLARRLHTHLEITGAGDVSSADQRDDLLACLYGLDALLTLHFAQEEESFFVLAPSPADGPADGQASETTARASTHSTTRAVVSP